MIRAWPFILGLLTQFASCVDHQLQQMDPMPVAQIAEVRHVGMVEEDQFVLVSGKPDTRQPRTLVRIDEDANERSLILQSRDTPRCLGEALMVRRARWWYSRCSGNGVQFVGSDAPGSPSFVSDSGGLDAREWLPLEQDEPEGVLLSVEKDERTMVAKWVTPSGIQKTLGRFDRGSSLWGAEPGQAVRLGADGVALITIETTSSDPVQSSIVLRVIQDGEIATSRVAFHESGWTSVAAAMGPEGDLAIVAAPFDGSGIVVVVLDPAQPDEAITRYITESAAYPGVRLTAGGARFIAGWIRLRDRAVRIAEFDRRVVLPAVTIADRAGSTPAISLGHIPGEDSLDLTVFWTDDDGSVMMRRLAEPPTGSLIAHDLLREFSNWARHRER